MSNTDIYPPQSFSSTGLLTQSTSSRTNPDNPWGPETTTTTTNPDTNGARHRLGYVTPNFIYASNFGNLNENSFSFFETVDRACRGDISYEEAGWFASKYEASGIFSNNLIPNPFTNSISTIRRSNLNNEVKQKVLDRIKDSDVNIAVTWAEREQAISMLGSSLARLGKAYNLAKSGNFSGAAAALSGGHPSQSLRRSIANSWLELQYGWLPLMSDIYGACKTLQKQMTHREYVVVSARSKIQDAVSFVTPLSGGYQDFTSADALYEASVRVKMKSSSMFLKTAAEVGLTNPALVAWELVPFSFVVDWAVPIGRFLSQFDASLGWHFETGSLTGYYKCFTVVHKSVHHVPATLLSSRCSIRREIETVEVGRTGITSFLGLLSIPAFKNPASLLHAANALALLTQKR